MFDLTDCVQLTHIKDEIFGGFRQGTSALIGRQAPKIRFVSPPSCTDNFSLQQDTQATAVNKTHSMPPSPDNQDNSSAERGMASKPLTECSLELHPSQAPSVGQGTETMGIFLNQVAQYDAQVAMNEKMNPFSSTSLVMPDLLTTHEHSAKIESNSNDISQLNTLDLHDTNQIEYDSLTTLESSSTSSGSKHGKAKAKESSSLLHSFVNPLLHAIPVLARNCLNFEDFLAQTALQGQNGLLGPKLDKEYTAPHKLILDPSRDRSTMMPKVEGSWQLRVLGLPPSGAKSRVETQIKICLQLIDSTGNPALHWPHLRLPEHLVAKDKLKRKHQKYAFDEKKSLPDSDVLSLEASVVCESHATGGVIMCTSCVQRERKRLQRKRDNKVARAVNKETDATKVASLIANELPDLNDNNVMAEERRKILLFNCNEYLEFNNGEATLPTRVTCYCRHHNEKIGFRIVFTLKDCNNNLIATGRSPPIMITDDHKSAKVQKESRKRVRLELDGDMQSAVDAAPSLKKKTNSSPTNGNGEGETDSGVSSPMASTPATPTSQTDDIPPASPSVKRQEEDEEPCKYLVAESSSQTVTNDRHPSNSGSRTFDSGMSQDLNHQQQELKGGQRLLNQQNLQTGQLYDYHNTNPMLLPTHMASQLSPMPSNQHDNTIQAHHQLQQYLYSSNPVQTTFARRRVNASPPNWQTSTNSYTKLLESQSMEAAKATQNAPHLHRLIPAEGPIYGGSEVTVLGSNFYEGLTCLFGDNPAVPTHCWSANTLLCILPPAATAGPVVVSFKEHPLLLEGQDVVLFTYLDETDRALMELALQVVGLKTLGKVEDARQIAMRIVQGDGADKKGYGNIPFANGPALDFRKHLTSAAATAAYHNARETYLFRLEEQVMAAIVAAGNIDTYCQADYISLMNRNRHTLLHLATLCGHSRLVRMLVKLGCDVNQVDHNGFTALHFASWTGKISIVKALISKADIQARNKVGKTAEKLAQEAGHVKVARFLRDKTDQRLAATTTTTTTTTNIITKLPTPNLQTKSAHTAEAKTPNHRTRLSDLISSFYFLSLSAPCLYKLAQSIGHMYSVMFDPF